MLFGGKARRCGGLLLSAAEAVRASQGGNATAVFQTWQVQPL